MKTQTSLPPGGPDSSVGRETDKVVPPVESVQLEGDESALERAKQGRDVVSKTFLG